MTEQQSYANHVRWYPLVHFVIFPLLVLNFFYQAVRLYQEPSWDRGIWVILCMIFPMMAFAARTQALRAQDRVIRLEEQLRYASILPADLAQKASELPPGKIRAMRFAPDEELADIVAQVCEGRLTTSKEIKMAVKNWRADHHRV